MSPSVVDEARVHDALAPPALTEARRRFVEAAVLFTMAGPISERRAWRCERLWPWWRFRVGEDRANAFHESSHAVIAERGGGLFVHRISLVSDPAVEVGRSGTVGGFIITSTSAVAPPSLQLPARLPTDRQTIAKCCLELGGGWKAGIREYHRLRAQADRLVNENWLTVRAVARALSERRTLDRAEFLAVLESSRTTAA